LNNYEGMFLLDPGVLTDWESVQKEIYRILERAEAEVVACSRWDERRLAYEINGRRRGVYALTYFKADPAKIVGIERDVHLSESALRCLILRVDDAMTDEQMKEAASPGRIEEQKTAGEMTEEESGGFGGPRRDRDRDRRRGDEERPAPVRAADASPEE
jgi:small subunit ribosomal protein S6